MRVLGTSFAAAALLTAILAPAHAATEWNGFIAATSDYVYRGVSQSQGEPAIQADLHVDTGTGTFIGAWASSTRPVREIDTTLELDIYLGHSWSLADDWRARLTAVHYAYLDTSWAGPRDYDELIGALSFRDRITASVAWSPNTWRYAVLTSDRRASAASFELVARQPFADHWYLAGGAGYYDLGRFEGGSYWYWSGGVGYARSRYRIDVTGFGLDAGDRTLLYGDSERGRWAATVTWQF